MGVAPDSKAADSRAIMESILLEDGVAATLDGLTDRPHGLDPVELDLALLSLIAGDLASRLRDPDAVSAPGVSSADDSDPYLVMAQWENVLGQVQAVLNQVGAARATAVAQYARYGTPCPDQPVRRHPAGYRDEFAGDQLAPLLALGTHEANTIVDESVWMSTRTPRLLARVAAGVANLATTAAIARELQDARPDTCEHVEDTVLTRGVQHATRVSARRSARTLVERYEATAARQTRTRTIAQQTGVWLDPHPTPGLALLSAAMPTADAEALMTAIEQRATATHRGHTGESGDGTPDGRTLGQHRAGALRDLALQGVTLTAHLDLIVTGPSQGGATNAAGATTTRPPQVGVPATAMALLPYAGAVPADDLASAIATWPLARTSVAILDPGALRREQVVPSGVADPGSTAAAANTYRPSISLRHAVARRDRHCRFPGCTRPARYTDLDHVRPWPHGPTAISNLQCLCRRHHRAKHQRWRVTMTSAGDCTWTSPTGRTYLTRPGLTADLADLTAPARHDQVDDSAPPGRSTTPS